MFFLNTINEQTIYENIKYILFNLFTNNMVLRFTWIDGLTLCRK